MQPNQFKMIHEIFLRNYETAYPRGGLRIINGIKIRAGANANYTTLVAYLIFVN